MSAPAAPQYTIPTDVDETLRDLTVQLANVQQANAILKGQISALMRLLTPEQLKTLEVKMDQPTPAPVANNRAERRTAKKTAARRPAA